MPRFKPHDEEKQAAKKKLRYMMRNKQHYEKEMDHTSFVRPEKNVMAGETLKIYEKFSFFHAKVS